MEIANTKSEKTAEIIKSIAEISSIIGETIPAGGSCPGYFLFHVRKLERLITTLVETVEWTENCPSCAGSACAGKQLSAALQTAEHLQDPR